MPPAATDETVGEGRLDRRQPASPGGSLGEGPTPPSDAAALVELTAAVLRAQSTRQAADVLAEQLARRCQARLVAVGWVRGRGPRCRLLAVSGRSDVRRDSDLTTRLERAMSETAAAPGGRCLWTGGAIGDHPARGHQPLAEQMNAMAIASVSLAADEETGQPTSTPAAVPRAVLTVIDPAPHQLEPTVRLLDAASSPLEAALASVAGQSWTRRLARTLRSGRRLGQLLAAASVATLLITLLQWPVPYRIAATCTAQPAVRRFVVAPHEGLVTEGYVRAGDEVEAGQPLGQMDGREVRWGLVGLQADLSKAQRARDAALAAGDIPKAQASELEARSLTAELRTARRRESELTLAAPIAGRVLEASLEPGDSLPVREGAALFEIGSVSPLRVEVAVPADVWSHVRAGQTVQLQFDGLPAETFTATLTKLRPQVEAREGTAALVAECELANPEGRLRPGFTGTARVIGETAPLGWTLTHRSWESLRRRFW